MIMEMKKHYINIDIDIAREKLKYEDLVVDVR